MLIYTYEVEMPNRSHPLPYSFTSREEAARFRELLAQRGLSPRMVEGPYYYVADAEKSVEIYEREINEKP